MLWNQQVETLPRMDMTVWQSHKLKKVLERVYEKSILYKSRMEQYHLIPENIRGVDELKKLPLTTRQDLAANYPYGMLTMPVSGVSYIHTTEEPESGPLAVCYTRNDMGMWTELMSRILVGGGINMASIFQCLGMDGKYTSTAGLHYSLGQTGATLLPDSTCGMLEQAQLMEEFGITAIFADPFYLLMLAKEAGVQGGERKLPLQNIFCDSRHLSALQGKEIEQIFGIRPVVMYGICDLWGMAVAGECQCHSGLHIQEDCFYPEVIQPATGEVLSAGETGELVLTSLALEAMPLLRFRTGVRCRLDEQPCACGRTLTRMRLEGEEKTTIYHPSCGG